MTPRKAAVLLLVLFLGTCNQAIMTAPPGSTFATGTLVANPGFIAAHGDVSVISGLVLKATGIPVADGTVVQFFTNLGKIDEQGKTNDGVVRVNLVSDSRSGTATVTAFTGASAGPSFLDGPVVGFSTGSITGGSAVSAAMDTATATVIIGSARPDHVVLTANPPRIKTGTSTTLLAQVFDKDGNPVANVPVIFQIIIPTSGTVIQGRLDSGGQAVFTDNDGRATDILRTNSTVAGDITVTATAANGKASPSLAVPVFINP
jgi:hypothetical protein